MKFPPAATYLSKIANDVASSVVVPNRIAPRLSTLTLRAEDTSLPMVVYRMPSRSQFARARSQAEGPASSAGLVRPANLNGHARALQQQRAGLGLSRALSVRPPHDDPHLLRSRLSELNPSGGEVGQVGGELCAAWPEPAHQRAG